MDVCLSEYVPSMKNTVPVILLDPLCTVWSAPWTSTMLLSTCNLTLLFICARLA